MIVADTHIHVYPHYSLSSVVFHAERNIRNALKDQASHLTQIILCVCDRTNFPALREVLRQNGSDTEFADDDVAQLFSFGGKETPVSLLESKQWVTQEGFEILGLGSALILPDRLRAIEYVRTLKSEGAAAVIPWSPGKWMFKRGKLLRSLLRELAVGDVLLGDIFMRPKISFQPPIMSHYRRKGGRIIAGSDPLPLLGEENIAGRYSSLYRVSSIMESAEDAVQLIRAQDAVLLGERATVSEFSRRFIGAFRAKGAGRPAV